MNRSQLGNHSQISSINNEDENLIRVNSFFHRELNCWIVQTKGNISPIRTESPPTPVRKDQPQQQSSKSIGIDIGEYKRLSSRQKVAAFMNSRCMDWFFISLIVIYMGLVFANIAVDSGCNTSSETQLALQILRYIEIGILALFMLEILIKWMVMGFKVNLVDEKSVMLISLINRLISRTVGSLLTLL